MSTPTTEPTPKTTPPTVERLLSVAEIALFGGDPPPEPHSFETVALDSASVACPVCGSVIRWDAESASRSVRVSAFTPVKGQLNGTSPGGGRGADRWRAMSRCPSCEPVPELARRLAPLVDHDAIGGRVIDAERIELALDALHAAGGALPDPTTLDRPGILALVRHLSDLGSAVQWSSHAVAPAPTIGALLDHAPASPWLHVQPEVRSKLTRARVDLSAEKLAHRRPPVAIAPPALPSTPTPTLGGGGTDQAVLVPSGCIMCGLGSVEIPADRALRLNRDAGGATRALWQRHTFSPSLLGIRSATPGATITGHTCPDCSAAIAAEGSPGWSATFRAATVALGLWEHAQQAQEDVQVTAWGALVFTAAKAGRPAPTPNAESWAHIDRAELVAVLAPLVLLPPSTSPIPSTADAQTKGR